MSGSAGSGASPPAGPGASPEGGEGGYSADAGAYSAESVGIARQLLDQVSSEYVSQYVGAQRRGNV